MTDRAEILVACVVLIDEQGRCLLNSRPEGKVYAGWWEFPGGKLEAMETVEAAARREMKEELGIVVPSLAMDGAATGSGKTDFWILFRARVSESAS